MFAPRRLAKKLRETTARRENEQAKQINTVIGPFTSETQFPTERTSYQLLEP